MRSGKIEGNVVGRRLSLAGLEAAVKEAVVKHVESRLGREIGHDDVLKVPVEDGTLVPATIYELAGVSREFDLQTGRTLSIGYSFVEAVQVGGREVAIPESVVLDAIRAYCEEDDAETDEEKFSREQAEAALEAAGEPVDLTEVMAHIRSLEAELAEQKALVASLTTGKSD